METIKINENDVKYCIKKLSNYDDCYSSGIVSVFKHYLEHKDFKQMRDELETVPHGDKASHNLWDISARMFFFRSNLSSLIMKWEWSKIIPAFFLSILFFDFPF